MKKAAYELNDAMMELVNGGDNGDADRDTNPSASLYHVGDHVEIYTNHLFGWTYGGTIIQTFMDLGHWYYRVHFDDKGVTGSGCGCFTANNIERS